MICPISCVVSTQIHSTGCVPAWLWASPGKLQPWQSSWQSPGGNQTSLKLLPCLCLCCCTGAGQSGHKRGQEHGQGRQDWLLFQCYPAGCSARGGTQAGLPGSYSQGLVCDLPIAVPLGFKGGLEGCWLWLRLAQAMLRGQAVGAALQWRPWLWPPADGNILGCGPCRGCSAGGSGCRGVQRADGTQPPSPPGSTTSPAAFITTCTATCPAQTPAAFGGHGAFLVEVLEQLSLHTSCLPRKSLQRGCQEEPVCVCRLGAR